MSAWAPSTQPVETFGQVSPLLHSQGTVGQRVLRRRGLVHHRRDLEHHMRDLEHHRKDLEHHRRGWEHHSRAGVQNTHTLGHHSLVSERCSRPKYRVLHHPRHHQKA